MSIQHHMAHVLSCMAENDLEPPVLGVSWDGTGYGPDGTIWGGEFFLVTEAACERVAHLRPFRLPGGDAAVKEPRRAAVGLLYEIFGGSLFSGSGPAITGGVPAPLATFSISERATLRNMLERGLNSPWTSSAGRLFDAVAACIGLRQRTRFEGQAAMELEFALEGVGTDETYPLPIASPVTPQSALRLDWAPMMESVLADVKSRVPVGAISARFHNALVEAIVAVAKAVRQDRVALSGGCFQNRYLTERTVRRLREEGFRPYWHQRVPPNDGGIALGQIIAAVREAK